jgi:small subunit ribosomal protein S3
MGRKVNPIGFRLGVIRASDSRWFAEGREYSRRVVEDARIRGAIRHAVGRAGVARSEIERFPTRLKVVIHTAKPGIVIGRRGASVNALKASLEALTGMESSKLSLDVVEIVNPELSALVVAESIAEQLERRVSHRRALRRAMQLGMRAGAKGIRISVQGRLSGAEMARRDWVREGRVPLHTLRADIDYAAAEALTTFGRIGVKVWVYRGDILPERESASIEAAQNPDVA